MARTQTQSGRVSLPPVITVALAVAALYFARDVLIPFALALLLAFLLSPVVKRLEMWRVPRVAAVVAVMLLVLGAVTGLGWVVSNQLYDILNELPQYRENIRRKMTSVRGKPSGIERAFSNLEEFGKEITIASTKRTAAPLAVEVVPKPLTMMGTVREMLGPLMAPLGTAGIVIVFAVFMMLEREDLRNRLLRLIGQRQLHVTTTAMDDAAQRVSRFLLMQSVVNASFGLVIGLGLYGIGIPSAALWGVLAMLLRFLPYVGSVTAGALPLLLAIAATEGWHAPLLVGVLFLVTELIIGNAVEPWLYGAHTGLSAVAILVSAVFWTVLWGPVGLLLAMPLTVCLGVVGRHTPQLNFLHILLGDEPGLPPGALFYQRLLARHQADAYAVMEKAFQTGGLVGVYDTVLVPALALAEHDRHGGVLDPAVETFVSESINEFISEVAGLVGPAEGVSGAKPRVLCVPAHDAADEIAAYMMAQLLEREGYPTLAFPVIESPAELLGQVDAGAGDVVCVSSVPPFALTNARRVSKRLRQTFPDLFVVAGLWGYAATNAKAVERLKDLGASCAATTMGEALAFIGEEAKRQPRVGADALQ